MITPTEQQYKQFQKLYNHFNKWLFANQLPSCLLLFSTRVKKVKGYFASQRWQNETGMKAYEITMNPYFTSKASDLEICKKLVEVMTTLWQCQCGTPSRSGYYNKEYAEKLESIGLIPSHTGKEGGNRTGQNMDSYPHLTGRFIKAYRKISKNWLFPFRLAEEEWTKLSTNRKKMNKATYRCSCGVTVFGKPNLTPIECKMCMTLLKMV